MVLSLNTACLTSDLLGNDAGVTRPELAEVVTFCLLGLGADVDRAWVDDVTSHVRLPTTASWFPGIRPASRPSKNGKGRS